MPNTEVEGRGTGRRNDPNNVCTYEYMNKGEKKEKNCPTQKGW
jgi:hypothetical protein